LISVLKKHGKVVATTGCKSQDLALFKIADVALSFGVMGSDITKS
jgi:magnesium-transporting ATPase (P-type)